MNATRKKIIKSHPWAFSFFACFSSSVSGRFSFFTEPPPFVRFYNYNIYRRKTQTLYTILLCCFFGKGEAPLRSRIYILFYIIIAFAAKKTFSYSPKTGKYE